MSTLTWREIVEHCSRLHTTRRRPIFPWEPNGEQREASEMLDIIAAAIPATIVPTRMHEPGFYVRSRNGTGDYWNWRGDDELAAFRKLVEAGSVTA